MAIKVGSKLCHGLFLYIHYVNPKITHISAQPSFSFILPYSYTKGLSYRFRVAGGEAILIKQYSLSSHWSKTTYFFFVTFRFTARAFKPGPNKINWGLVLRAWGVRLCENSTPTIRYRIKHWTNCKIKKINVSSVIIINKY